jgi:hypothetical protein
VAQALAEISAYYLLAWRPDAENEGARKGRLEVSIKGRPDLHVRVRRHSFDFRATPPTATINNQPGPAAGPPANELLMTLGSLYPRRDLPVSVSAALRINQGQEAVLNVSMQVDSEMLGFDILEGKEKAVVDVLGVALDDRGAFSSFKQKLEIPRAAVLVKDGRLVKWSQSLTLPAGLYQVRVAVRDRKSGRNGSAMTWIEIPGVARASHP